MANEVTISQLPKKAQVDPYDDLIITDSRDGSSARVSAQQLADQVSEITKDLVIEEATASAAGYTEQSEAFRDQAELFRDQARDASANATANREEKGDWNPNTNTPALTANAATGSNWVPGVSGKPQSYTIVAPGNLPFAIKDHAQGTPIGVGYLVQHPTGQWYYDVNESGALTKVNALEAKAAVSSSLDLVNPFLEVTTDVNNWAIHASFADGTFYPPYNPKLLESGQLSAALIDRIDSGKYMEKTAGNLITTVEDVNGVVISGVTSDGYPYPPAPKVTSVLADGTVALSNLKSDVTDKLIGTDTVPLVSLKADALARIDANKFSDVAASNLISATVDPNMFVLSGTAADGYPYPPAPSQRYSAPEVQERDTYNRGKEFTVDRLTVLRAPDMKNPEEIEEASASWWCYPSCIAVKGSEWSCVGPSNYSFFGYVSTEGDQYIARVQDYAAAPGGAQRKISTRCVSPASVFQCDEHNVPAIQILGSNQIIVASAGHYDKSEIDVRIWNSWNDDKPVIRLKTNGPCSYAQIAVLGSKVFIFTRDEQYRWSVFTSLDNGLNWSPCTPFLLGIPSERAYMRIMKSSGDYLKIYWYPSTDEKDNSFVRYAEVNMNTGEILDRPGGTVLGNVFTKFTPIPMYTGGTLLYTNAGIADEIAGGNRRLRLLDVSGANRNEAVFLVATLTGTAADITDRNGDYRVVTVDLTPPVAPAVFTATPVSTKLTDYGKAFYQSPSAYMGGAFFEQSLTGARTGIIYLAKFGTASTTYNPADANNKFRVEKWTSNAFTTLIEETTEQLFRPFTPQFFSDKFGVLTYYMKGLYLSFNNYYSKIKMNRI